MDRTRWLAAAITILVIVTLVLGPLLEVFASLQL
jgi:heme exporter protein D